ncbi:MAG: phenylalanine--tRNA ligase subunit alpha [bacterium]|nr:phenylalanine--tRNA ligase subunit alpha [bacterium]
MKQKILDLRDQALASIKQVKSVEHLKELEVSLLGKKGQLTAMLKGLKELSEADRRVVGKMANDLKQELAQTLVEKEQGLKRKASQSLGQEFYDTSLPGRTEPYGHLHPITQFIREIEDTFLSLNFEVAEGPQIEDDYHNFTALNIPKDHPARDMQDTLWCKDIPYLLRTHTSCVQVRYMESHDAPIRVVVPGRVFRKDDVDATHSPMFHQFEGIMVDTTTNLSHLKGILTIALRRLVNNPQLELRFRSGFFPFVEPGLEVDVTCVGCEGKGCNICKKTGWLELLGCGMVHPYVLKTVGLDPEKYQGFAFGAGIERLLMIKHKINDIRLFYENDPRFLEQF